MLIEKTNSSIWFEIWFEMLDLSKEPSAPALLTGARGSVLCGLRPCGPGARSVRALLEVPLQTKFEAPHHRRHAAETSHEAPGAWSRKPPHHQRSKSEWLVRD